MSSLKAPSVGLGKKEEGQEPGGPARSGDGTGRSGVSRPREVSFAAEDSRERGPSGRGWQPPH